MAKSVAKRKAEGAVPAAKVKQRKVMVSSKANDLSGSEEREDECSDDLFIEDEGEDEDPAPKHIKKTSKARKSEPARPTRTDEYDEDIGRMESQEFLALVEIESKNKKQATKEASEYLEKFNQTVKNNEQALKKEMQSSIIALSKKDTDFLKSFRTAFAAATPRLPPPPKDGEAKQDPDTLRGFAVQYQRTQKVTEAAREILERFDAIAQDTFTKDSSILLDNDWAEEQKVTAENLSLGRKVLMTKCNAILDAMKPPVLDEAETSVEEALLRDHEDDNSTGWGNEARLQEKSAKRYYRTYTREYA